MSLENAVGLDFSLDFLAFTEGGRRLQTSQQDRFALQIFDSENLGVFTVDMSVPMMQTEGIYDFALYLGGKQVVTPLVDLLSCSNAFAAERGLLEPAGNIQYIDSLTYTIGTE